MEVTYSAIDTNTLGDGMSGGERRKEGEHSGSEVLHGEKSGTV